MKNKSSKGKNQTGLGNALAQYGDHQESIKKSVTDDSKLAYVLGIRRSIFSRALRSSCLESHRRSVNFSSKDGSS